MQDLPRDRVVRGRVADVAVAVDERPVPQPAREDLEEHAHHEERRQPRLVGVATGEHRNEREDEAQPDDRDQDPRKLRDVVARVVSDDCEQDDCDRAGDEARPARVRDTLETGDRASGVFRSVIG